MNRKFFLGIGLGWVCTVLFIVGLNNVGVARGADRVVAAAPATTQSVTQTLTLSTLDSPTGGGGGGDLGTAISYQGLLKKDGTSFTGSCDMRFKLYDTQSAVVPITTVTPLPYPVPVTNGLFTTEIDFGDQFTGQYRYLEVDVSCPASGGPSWQTLAPRQVLYAAPYALSLRPGATISGTASPALSIISSQISGYGVYGEGLGRGVYGYSPNGVGVVGNALSGPLGGTGVTGYGSTGVRGTGTSYGVTGNGLVGIYGESGSDTGYGVYGYNSSNLGAGVKGQGSLGPGVSGTGTYTGVTGLANASNSSVTYGVYGRAYSVNGFGTYGYSLGGIGAAGVSSSGNALYGYNNGQTRDKAALRVFNTNPSYGMSAYITNTSNYATAHFANDSTGEVLYLQNGGTDAGGTNGGDFIKAVNHPENDAQFRVLTSGEVRSDVGFNTPAADFAEMLPAAPGLEPGDVLMIGPDGKLTRSTQPNQTTVVGVYSTRPGFIAGGQMAGEPIGKVPLAVVGVVPVKVTAENGAIQPGDLLTTSSISGHAMKAGDQPAVGTVIGKALASLKSGSGVILMLVTLQ